MGSVSAYTLFAATAAITPGPTNLLILANAQRFGLRRSWPLVMGASAGAVLLLLGAGWGLGDLINRWPMLQPLMSGLSALWLIGLAWQLARLDQLPDTQAQQQPASWWLGLGLQWVNPKSWMMALATSSLFLQNDSGAIWQAAFFAGLLFCIAAPCLGLWAWAGSELGALLQRREQVLWTNRLLALLLLGSVLWVL